jgi:hypothetical protein
MLQHIKSRVLESFYLFISSYESIQQGGSKVMEGWRKVGLGDVKRVVYLEYMSELGGGVK